MLNTDKDMGIIDLLSAISLMIGIANYGQNLNQNDKQELMKAAIAGISAATDELHLHLKSQDAKLDKIISMLEELKK